MSNFRLSTAIAAICATTNAFVPSIVAAQDSVAQLEEIVVVAQKREQNIMDVPLSIVSVSADDLQQNGVENALDLKRIVPNFYASRGSSVANTRFVMRGIGTAGNTAVDQSIAVFLDGVYIARPSALYSNFLDIASVEVVRGPQGTLFGRNTTAGGIILNSARPEPENSLKINAEVASHKHRKLELIGNLAVDDDRLFRLAAQSYSRDGYGSSALSGSNYGDKEGYSLRASADLSFENGVNWLLRFDRAVVEGDGQNANEAVAATLSGPALARLSRVLGGAARLPELNNPHDHDINHIVGGDLSDEQWGFSSELSMELGDDYTLSLISGFRDYDNEQYDEDIIFLPIPLVARNSGLSSRSWSQELRLISPTDLADGKLNYVAGLYYYKEDAGFTERTSLSGVICNFARPAALKQACLAGPLDNATSLNFDQSSKSAAAYAQADYSLNDEWTLQVGARYTRDKRDGRFLQQAPNRFAALALRRPENTLLKFSDNKPTYRLALNYQSSNDLLWFASYSSGYKSGGFDSGGGQSVRDANSRTFESEDADNFELGLKGGFWDKRLDAALTFYRTELSNFQARSFDGASFSTRNAAELRHQGFELDVNMALSDEISLAAGVAYLDSKFSEFEQAQALPGCTNASPAIAGCGPVGSPRNFQDLSGGENHFAPEWSGNLRINVEGDLGQWQWRANLSASYMGEQFIGGAIDNNPQVLEDDYWLSSARFTLSSPDDWELAIFANNLFDQSYCSVRFYQPLGGQLGVTDATTGGTLGRCNPGAPRSVGASVSLSF